MAGGDLVLVTGAAGFVGAAVARAALEQGYAVRALVRASSPRRNLAGLSAEVVAGDMRDAAAVGRALAGVRFLLHVAADYRLWAPDPGEVIRNNLEGTATVMRAALAAVRSRRSAGRDNRSAPRIPDGHTRPSGSSAEVRHVPA